MRKLYCGNCSNYLMGADGECHDCRVCGWKQAIEPEPDQEMIQMNEDQQRVVRDFIAENWADFEARCEESGEDAQEIYEELGGTD